MIIKSAPSGLINYVLSFCPEIADNIDLPIIAGGFVRAYFAGEKPSDLDLYFRDPYKLVTLLDNLRINGWIICFQTDRAVSLVKGNKLVQLISVIYGDPAQVIEAFDFTICCAAVTLRSGAEVTTDDNPTIVGDLYLHDDFMEHLAGRILVYTGSTLPLSSLKRAFKYVKRGYSICDENIISLAESIINANIFSGSEEDIEEHIAGMDSDGARRIRVID